MIVPFPTPAAAEGAVATEGLLAAEGSDAALSQCRRLARVLTVTREMVALAEVGDWDAVAAREQDRRDDLARCFKEAVSTEHAELVAEALAAILHLNAEMMAHDAVLQQGVAQVRTRSAIGHYEQVKSQP